MLAAATVAVIAATFGLGLFVGGISELPAETIDSAAGLPPSEAVERPGEAAVSPPTGMMALAASAEDGDAKAQFQIGMAHFNGQGTERDTRTALRWIEKSAEQGFVEAQYALGALHHAGNGALQSFPLAFKWFELAAQRNHAEAQYSLGMLYRSGRGVAIDKSKAYMWFNLAAAQGHERAREARDMLLPTMSPEQVLAAQRAAQEWRPVETRN